MRSKIIQAVLVSISIYLGLNLTTLIIFNDYPDIYYKANIHGTLAASIGYVVRMFHEKIE